MFCNLMKEINSTVYQLSADRSAMKEHPCVILHSLQLASRALHHHHHHYTPFIHYAPLEPGLVMRSVWSLVASLFEDLQHFRYIFSDGK